MPVVYMKSTLTGFCTKFSKSVLKLRITVKLAISLTFLYAVLIFFARKKLFEINGIVDSSIVLPPGTEYVSLGIYASIQIPLALCALNFYLIFLVSRFFLVDRAAFFQVLLCWVSLLVYKVWVISSLAYSGIILPIVKTWPMAVAFLGINSLVAIAFPIILNSMSKKITSLHSEMEKASKIHKKITQSAMKTTTNIDPAKNDLVNRDMQFVSKMKMILSENISDSEFSVDQLANELALERSTLFRKTQQYFDASPSDLIVETRLNCAKKLLLKNEGSITEIASNVGYNSASHFSHSFKKYFKCSPSQFRKQEKKNPST